MEDINIIRRIFIVFGISLLITALLISLYRGSFEKLNENSSKLLHSMKILESTEELLGLMKDTETGTRGFVITGDSSYLEPYTNAKTVVENKFNELRKLTSDNPNQQKLLDSVNVCILSKLETQSFIIHLKNSNLLKFGYAELLMDSKLSMDSIRELCSKMKQEEALVRERRDQEVQSSLSNTKILSTIFSLTAISIIIISLISILKELKSKKRLQNLLQTVLESSQSGIMSFKSIRDPLNGRIIDFEFIQSNKQGGKMLGISTDEIIGMKLLDVFPGNKPEGLFDEYVKTTQTGQIYRGEKYYKHDNLDLWLRIVAVKLEDGFTVTFDDISNEKKYEINLQNSIKELERSNKELEQFAFIASHDLQEPLRKIQSFGDRLMIKSKEKLEPESMLYIEKMLSAANRMSNLINDLLKFSRLTTTSDPFVQVNLNKVVTEVLSDLELPIRKKNADIRIQNLPVIDAVYSQMYQLFFNLIGNALKFSRSDVNPEINITIEEFSRSVNLEPNSLVVKKEKCISIAVRDNGIGFDNEYADRIFEIFQRLNGRSEYEGTGIGLAICKRIVNNHKGNLFAMGTPGQGSTFIIELPIKQS